MRSEGLEPGIWQQHLEAISALIERELGHKPRAEILEAGCGSGSWLRFPANARLTGIDISREQLARNTRIHERIQGDLQTFHYTPGSFDAVVCWDVLEHLDTPAAALERFATALSPGGLLVLGFPDRQSLKGQLTRVLPHRTHVWLYRWILGVRNAGTGDRGPFPTPMRPEMAREAVIAQMRQLGFGVVTDVTYESPMMVAVRRRVHLVDRRWALAQGAVRTLTAGKVAADTTDCMLVMRKGAAGP